MHEQTNAFWLQREARDDVDLPPLHFAHGNSFPTGSYRVFLEHLKGRYQIHAPDMLGHNPVYPVSDNWPNLCQEMIASIESIGSKQPVILLGHSLGGMLSLMVAKMRPDLVRSVLLLDSPVVAGWRVAFLKFTKLTRLIRIAGPGRFSRKRRKSWPDAASAYQHFADKEAFAIWPEQVLRDYIEFGTESYPNGVTLRFKREIETDIYCTLPDNLRDYVEKPYPVPIGFICGTTSAECRQAGLGPTRQLVGDQFQWIEGGHLYPMESPELAAQMTMAMLEKLTK
jgi:pimeloyl-ACP methyl ester carboxylesterase